MFYLCDLSKPLLKYPEIVGNFYVQTSENVFVESFVVFVVLAIGIVWYISFSL